VEDVEVPNPPNGLAGFSVLCFQIHRTLVVAGFSDVPDDPKRDGVVLLSFSLSSLKANTEVVDDPPNELRVVE
jgi:hypothetical protein